MNKVLLCELTSSVLKLSALFWRLINMQLASVYLETLRYNIFLCYGYAELQPTVCYVCLLAAIASWG